ncbi:MAG: hypothetical protein WA958_07865 [Tunicatimonas sp.]
MNLNELKQTWQQEDETKSEQQLQEMTKQRARSVFSKIKLRAIIESIALLVALLVFFTGLDADQNATWVNVLFALAIFAGVANNGVLYRRTVLNAKGDNLITSLRGVSHQLQWQIRLAVVFSALLFVGAFAFLLWRVPLTDQKLMVVFLVLPAIIGIRTWFEVYQWRRSLRQVRYNLTELGEGA